MRRAANNDAVPRPVVVLLAACASLAGCGRDAAPAWSGYVEGDFVYVAAPLPGALTELAVQRGQNVARGAPLFVLEAQSEREAREEAAARLASARAQAANAGKGRRSDELAVTQAQLAQARAAAGLAVAELARRRALVAQNFISAAQLDDARTAAEQAQARVAELEAALRVGRLPARRDERQAAEAAALAASAALAQAAWREGQKRQSAPADALVSDTFFRVGEWVGAGQPVVALLPPGATRARFFVPEAELGRLALGQPVLIECDGCGAPIAARIDRIATQPEYTPPVIYSNAQRARLVFMVEARPAPADGLRLKPGQPVDVKRAPA
ncbi:MAG: HlyD family efflux transporter periplasmic adaptor subunit [Burkholderiales bacterium]|nr:HlyD family efflux transporter periplasmic adaptor subunit [Burkholderiales bacterium]